MISRSWGWGAASLALLFLAGFRSAAAQEDALAPLRWMSGCWLDQGPDGRSEEVWTTPGGGLLLGLSRSFSEPGRTAFEYMRVEARPEGVTLYASPGGAPPTAFTAVMVSEVGLRVERPDHDFPRAIEYRPVGRDSLVAHVFGAVDTDEPAFSLRFARVPCPVGSL